MIELEKVKNLLPFTVYDELMDTCTRFGLTNPLRLSHFLAHCHHESAGFTQVEENLNYSSIGLMRTFPQYFTDMMAESYAHDRRQIGSRVYADRMGNGNEFSQDGYKYRGRGYIQLTGKNNYQLFDNAVPDNIIDDPDLVATKYPLFSAGWFWGLNRLNDVADYGGDQQVVANITKVINGGFNGLADRQKLFDRYYAALSI